MKFFCEYCGNRIDAEKEHKCPHCGASYKNNKKFKQIEEDRNKEIQFNNETKQKVIGHVFGIMKFSKIVMIIPFVIFALIIITAIIITTNHDNEKFDEPKLDSSVIDDLFNDKKEEEKEVVVGIDEYGKTTKYQVKVTKYQVQEDRFNRLEEGYEYVKFDLVVENLTDNQISSLDVNCIVDGVAQKNEIYSGHSDLPFTIAKNLTVTGSSTFIVPMDATSYDIRYGDYVTIHIEK